MKKETLEFALKMMNDDLESLAPCVTRGLSDEEYQKFLRVATLLTIISKELID